MTLDSTGQIREDTTVAEDSVASLRATSRPALRALACITAGMVITHCGWLVLLPSLIVLIVALRRSRICILDQRLVGMLLFTGVILELARIWSLPVFSPNLPETAMIRGVVTRPVRRQVDHWSADIRLSTTKELADLRVRMLSPDTTIHLKERDHIEAFCRLFPLRLPRNPGEIAWDVSLHRRGCIARAWAYSIDKTDESDGSVGILLRDLRNHMGDGLTRLVGGAEGDLARAMLLGLRDHMDREILSSFRDAGIVHVLAVSGLHVGIITIMLVGAATVFLPGYRLPALFAGIGLTWYVLLVGGYASVLRAGIMAGAVLMGTLLDRKADPANSVGLAGLILLFTDPAWLWEPGFQLSFGATLGILLIAPRMSASMSSRPRMVAWSLKAVIASVCAQMGILPVVLLHFHQWPTYGLLANLPAVLLMAALLWFSVGTLLAMHIWLPIAQITAMVSRVAGACLLGLADMTSRLPGATVPWGGSAGWVLLICWGGGLMLLLVQGPRRPFWSFVVMLCIYCISLVHGIISPWESNLERISFLHVDGGNSIVLESPSRKLMLVDPGGPGKASSAKFAVTDYLRFRRVGAAERVMATGSGPHRIGAIGSLLEENRILNVIAPSSFAFEAPFSELVTPWADIPTPLTDSGYILHPLGLEATSLDGFLVESASGLRLLVLGELNWQADERLATLPAIDGIDVCYVGPPRMLGPSHLLLRRIRPRLLVVGGTHVLEDGARGRIQRMGCRVVETVSGAVIIETSSRQTTFRQLRRP